MWLIDLEGPPPALRGLLSRWGVEVRAGMYVGSTSARVRDDVWALVVEGLGDGNAVLVYDARNAQGFELRTAGRNRREVVNLDGIELVRFRPAEHTAVPWDESDLLDVDTEYAKQP